jgi:hypothetical protein
MSRDAKFVVLALLIMAAAMWFFLGSSHSFKTTPAEVVVVKDPCRVCGKSLYREEVDFYITTWIGDVPVLIPIYKTVLHTCKGQK